MADKDDGGKLDKILAHLDSVHSKMDGMGKRMDAMETSYGDGMKKLDAYCSKMDAWDEEKKDAAKADAARKDAEDEEKKAKADAARKDAEEEEKKKDAARKDAEEEEKKKADSARSNLSQADIDAKIAAAISAAVPKELAEEDRVKFVSTQAKWERIAQAFGDASGAPRFLSGETHDQYRRRLAGKYKQHSKTWKDVDLSTFADKALEVAETQIYADAEHSARYPTDLPPDTLRQVTKVDQANRTHISFVGSEKAAWLPFCNPDRKGRINTRFERA